MLRNWERKSACCVARRESGRRRGLSPIEAEVVQFLAIYGTLETPPDSSLSVPFMPRILLCLPLTIFLLAVVAGAAEPPDSVEFFEKRIRPVLVEHCYECHSADAEEIGGSLVLDSASGMMTGGDSGPAIKPGDAEASVLISAIRYESAEMPPEEPLPSNVVRDFEQWINAGAIDPRTNATAPPLDSREIDIEAGRQFWAFRSLQFTKPPGRQGGRSPIDLYLLAKLDEAGLVANELAPPATRLRRLAFDLTGLPPDQDLLSRWLADPTPGHWGRIVDSMLASPEYAEHWARHWMDVVRYADSNGSDFNATYHEAWRYRDYLVRSFAADRPFDQLVRQQVAGDLLAAESDQQRLDNVVATTFLMLGPKMLSERDKAKLELDVVDEQIDTVGRAFLGLTLGCARCHDHKFDPVPTEDYYALAGIFKSTQTLEWRKPEIRQHVESHPAADVRSARLGNQAAPGKSWHRWQNNSSQPRRTLKSADEKNVSPVAGIVIDDADAEKTGHGKRRFVPGFCRLGYVHDDNKNKGEASIRFTTRLPVPGNTKCVFLIPPVRIEHQRFQSRSRPPTAPWKSRRISGGSRSSRCGPPWEVLTSRQTRTRW